MKTINKTLTFLIATWFFYSCNDRSIDMYTRIYPDGSCYRDLEEIADSAYFAGNKEKNPFPFTPDSSWIITVNKETDTIAQGDSLQVRNHYRAKAFKEYPAVEDLAKTFCFDDENWDSLVPAIIYHQEFKLFYTYYSFTEIYPSINQFTVPVTEYLNEDEAETWFGESTDMYKGKNGVEIFDMLDGIERKVNAWCNRNYYEELFSLYLKYFRYFQNLPVDSLSFAMAKDSIYKHNKKSIETADMFDFNIEDLLDKHFERKLIFDPKKQVSDAMDEEMEQILEFLDYFSNNLDYGLSLPGKVIETNAAFISGDTLSWKVDAYRFFINDHTLTAKSRKPNYWAFIATGIIIVLSVVGFWVRKK